jgi:hypothetical protein
VGGQEHRLIGRASALAAFALLATSAHAQSDRTSGASACEALGRIAITHVTITVAKAIAAGKFTAPDGQTHTVPAFCRVHGEARPTRDSVIRFELWLPATGWNHRYHQLGSGGFAGRIHYPSLAHEVRLAHAVAATDTGHRASPFDASWALGHPERIVDYGYRSLKATSDAANALIRAYYSSPARHRYFIGCSNGGRQALMVAQRFFSDWEGVLAGAPGHDWTRRMTSYAAIQQALRSAPDSWIAPSKLPAIQRAALASCTAAARVVNGVPTDPRFCPFDPQTLVCVGADEGDCLTAAQAAALGQIQNGLTDSATGERIHFGFEATGATVEGHWASWMLNTEPREDSHLTAAEQFFRYFVFDDSRWSIERFDARRDLARARAKRVAGAPLAQVLDATSTNLEGFEKRGAKLLMYFGWADALISPRAAVDYYARVSERLGLKRTQAFFRLFMVPGMAHCQGGPAPNAFGQAPIAPALRDDALHDIRRALEAWVERGVAPERIIAVKYVNDDPARGVATTSTLYPMGGMHGRL